MCGFLGRISFESFDESQLLLSNKHIECRGPDSRIQFTNSDYQIKYSYIFNRLSILDLSDLANQPLHSEIFNSTVMFNGEIYNHAELRKNLENESVKFKTDHSDTEVVLNGLSKYGSNYIKKLRGQFSIFFHDFKNNEIILSRDRLGQKPLFYYIDNKTLIFGSNLNSLQELTKPKIDENQINKYIQLGVVTSPETIFRNIKKVEPGQLIKFNYSQGKFVISYEKYWKIEDFVDYKIFDQEEFFRLFSEAVDLRYKADVPVANFLSGGIDSTAIVKNLVDKDIKVNTFSVGFNSPEYDESYWFNEVANVYHTNHSVVNISSEIGINEIEESLASMDELYSDPSVVPSYLLSKEISKFYKVAISGDGADELLGGYSRVLDSLKVNSDINNLISKLFSFYPAYFGTGNYFLSKSNNSEIVYNSFLVDNNLANLLKINIGKNEKTLLRFSKTLDKYKSIQVNEFNFFLSEMMLLKVDRTSMKNSLEVRSPFVDHKLVEYVLSHNTNYLDLKYPKKILKNYLLQDFNNNFISRTKKGFVFDIENWVYNNKDYINEKFKNGKFVYQNNKNILKQLSIYKSRINAHRIWKLLVLENYL